MITRALYLFVLHGNRSRDIGTLCETVTCEYNGEVQRRFLLQSHSTNCCVHCQRQIQHCLCLARLLESLSRVFCLNFVSPSRPEQPVGPDLQENPEDREALQRGVLPGEEEGRQRRFGGCHEPSR